MDHKVRFIMSNILKNFDAFEEPVPSFSLGARKSIRTVSGAIVSIMIFSVTLGFAAMKY